MGAPVFLAESETAWATTTTPKTASVTVAQGDVLVIIAAAQSSGPTSLGPPSGGSQTYTLRQSVVVASRGLAYVWTAVMTTAQTYTISVTSSGGSGQYGFNVLRFSGSAGVGASSSTQVDLAAPSLGLTTTGANSAIVAVNADSGAIDGAVRTWRTVNGITPTAGNGLEVTYNRSAFYTAYGAYWSDVGAAGAKTLGLSAPGGQFYSIAAVEILARAPATGYTAVAATASATATTARPATAGARVGAQATVTTAKTAAATGCASVAVSASVATAKTAVASGVASVAVHASATTAKTAVATARASFAMAASVAAVAVVPDPPGAGRPYVSASRPLQINSSSSSAWITSSTGGRQL